MYDKEGLNNAMNHVAEIRMLLFGLFFLYLYFRKKYKVFLSMTFAFFAFTLVSYLMPSVAVGMKILILIGFFILVLAFNFKELNALDKSGKTAYEMFKPDRIDWSVFFAFLIIWVLLKIFLFEK
jgi:hypothetical protein